MKELCICVEEEEDGLGEEMRGDPKKGGRTGKK